jgi:uncharacterized protein YbaP (TraB family)
MKIFIVIIIQLLILSIFCFSQTSYEKTLLWRISGNGLNKPSFLFGTMHLRENRIFNFSDSVIIALKNCDVFAMEILPDSIFKAILSSEFERDDFDLRKLFTKKEIERINKKLNEKAGIDIEDIRHTPPMMVQYLLKEEDTSDNIRPVIVDDYLFDIARRNGKIMFGLETVSEQLNSISKISLEKQKSALLNNLNDDSDSSKVDSINILIDLYIDENLNEINRIMLESKDSLEYNELITVRNLRMLERIIPYIRTKSTFIAVGTAHLPGNSGLINLLRLKGFDVTPVKRIYTGYAKNYKLNDKINLWEKYTSKKAGFSIEFPGKFQTKQDLKPYFYDYQSYLDFTTFTFYHAFCLANPGIEKLNIDTILNNLQKLYPNKNFEVIDCKQMNFKNLPAYQITFKLGTYKNKCLYILRDNFFYTLLVSQLSKNKDFENLSELFFNTFDTCSFEISNRINYKNNHFGFEVIFPEKPTENSEVIPNNAKIHNFSAIDKEKGSTFFVQVINYNNGNYIEDHNLALSNYISIYSDALKTKAKLDKIEDSKIDHCFEKKLYFSANYNIQYTIRIIIRSSRIYILHCESASGDSLSSREFFDSFKLIDYDDARLFINEVSDFNAMLPSVSFIKDTITDRNSYPYSSSIFRSIDTNANIGYVLSIRKYSEFYQAKNDSIFFQELTDANLSEQKDSIIYSNKINSNNFTGRDILIKSNNSSNYKRIKYILKGNMLYGFLCIISERDLNSKTFEKIFNSISINQTPVKYDIFTDKYRTIFDNINTSDSISRTEIISAIQFYNFKQVDTDTIYKYLLFNYPDDSLGYNSTKYALLRKLVKMKNTNSINFIRNNFNQLSKNELLIQVMYIILSNIKTSESYNLLFELMQNNSNYEQSFRYFELFSKLKDSLDLTSKYSEQILSLVEKNYLIFNFYDLINTLLDSSKIQPNQFKRIETKLLAEAKTELDSIDIRALKYLNEYRQDLDNNENEDSYYSENQTNQDEEITNNDTSSLQEYRYTNDLEILIHLLGYTVSREETYEFINFLLSDSNLTLIHSAAIALIRNNKFVPDSILTIIAEHINERNLFYDELFMLKKDNLFPKKFKEQKYFAESDLFTTLEYEYDEDIPEIKFITVKSKFYDSINSDFYIFKIKYGYDSLSYFGVAGPYPSKNIKTKGDLTGTVYSYFDESKIDKLFDEYLDKVKKDKHNDYYKKDEE